MGVKKGLYTGLCQTFSQVTLYMAFTATFWCKYLDNLFDCSMYFNLDGPYLVRSECQNYSAGSVIVVCKTMNKRKILDIYWMTIRFSSHVYNPRTVFLK